MFGIRNWECMTQNPGNRLSSQSVVQILQSQINTKQFGIRSPCHGSPQVCKFLCCWPGQGLNNQPCWVKHTVGPQFQLKLQIMIHDQHFLTGVKRRFSQSTNFSSEHRCRSVGQQICFFFFKIEPLTRTTAGYYLYRWDEKTTFVCGRWQSSLRRPPRWLNPGPRWVPLQTARWPSKPSAQRHQNNFMSGFTIVDSKHDLLIPAKLPVLYTTWCLSLVGVVLISSNPETSTGQLESTIHALSVCH